MTALLVILACVLYRLGGWAHGNKLYRRLGVPCLTTVWLYAHGVHNIPALIVSGLLMAVALSTYWDFGGRDNYYVHGFGVGLSLAPVAYATGHLPQLIPAIALLTVWSGLWSRYWWQDWIEEGGRLLPLVPILYFFL